MSAFPVRHVLLALLLSWSAFCAGGALAFNGKDVSTRKIGGELNVADHNGVRRTLEQFRGKAVLIFFAMPSG